MIKIRKQMRLVSSDGAICSLVKQCVPAESPRSLQLSLSSSLLGSVHARQGKHVHCYSMMLC